MTEDEMEMSGSARPDCGWAKQPDEPPKMTEVAQEMRVAPSGRARPDCGRLIHLL